MKAMGRSVLTSGQLGHHNGLPATIVVVKVMHCGTDRLPELLKRDRTRQLNRGGATLSTVRAAHAVEAIAAEVVQQAECSHQLVTMSVINRVLEQLRAHRPTCRCGLCGEAAEKAKAAAVFRTASIWQRQVSATRARATR